MAEVHGGRRAQQERGVGLGTERSVSVEREGRGSSGRMHEELLLAGVRAWWW